MRVNYNECERRVLLSEGGYTNDPQDPGGPTNWGITLVDARLHWKPNATAEDVRAMPRSVAEKIYKEKYWDALRADALPAGVDYAVFDYGVNSGIGRAGRVLRAVLGLPSHDWHVDGEVLDALAHVNAQHVVDAICQERLTFLHGLKTWPRFGGGWGRRVASVKEYGDHLAKEAEGMAPPHPETNDATGKSYGDEHPIDAVPVPRPLPEFLRPKDTQTDTVSAQPASPVRNSDPPATQVAQRDETSPRASYGGWRPWAALGLGGSGSLDALHQFNDYASEISMAKFNLEALNAGAVLSWLFHHPLALTPIVVLAAAGWVWEEHRKYRRLEQSHG